MLRKGFPIWRGLLCCVCLLVTLPLAAYSIALPMGTINGRGLDVKSALDFIKLEEFVFSDPVFEVCSVPSSGETASGVAALPQGNGSFWEVGSGPHPTPLTPTTGTSADCATAWFVPPGGEALFLGSVAFATLESVCKVYSMALEGGKASLELVLQWDCYPNTRAIDFLHLGEAGEGYTLFVTADWGGSRSAIRWWIQLDGSDRVEEVGSFVDVISPHRVAILDPLDGWELAILAADLDEAEGGVISIALNLTQLARLATLQAQHVPIKAFPSAAVSRADKIQLPGARGIHVLGDLLFVNNNDRPHIDVFRLPHLGYLHTTIISEFQDTWGFGICDGRDTLAAISGNPGGSAGIYKVDPQSGVLAFNTALPAPLAAGISVNVAPLDGGCRFLFAALPDNESSPYYEQVLTTATSSASEKPTHSASGAEPSGSATMPASQSPTFSASRVLLPSPSLPASSDSGSEGSSSSASSEAAGASDAIKAMALVAIVLLGAPTVLVCFQSPWIDIFWWFWPMLALLGCRKAHANPTVQKKLRKLTWGYGFWNFWRGAMLTFAGLLACWQLRVVGTEAAEDNLSAWGGGLRASWLVFMVINGLLAAYWFHRVASYPLWYQGLTNIAVLFLLCVYVDLILQAGEWTSFMDDPELLAFVTAVCLATGLLPLFDPQTKQTIPLLKWDTAIIAWLTPAVMLWMFPIAWHFLFMPDQCWSSTAYILIVGFGGLLSFVYSERKAELDQINRALGADTYIIKPALPAPQALQLPGLLHTFFERARDKKKEPVVLEKDSFLLLTVLCFLLCKLQQQAKNKPRFLLNIWNLIFILGAGGKIVFSVLDYSWYAWKVRPDVLDNKLELDKRVGWIVLYCIGAVFGIYFQRQRRWWYVGLNYAAIVHVMALNAERFLGFYRPEKQFIHDMQPHAVVTFLCFMAGLIALRERNPHYPSYFLNGCEAILRTSSPWAVVQSVLFFSEYVADHNKTNDETAFLRINALGMFVSLVQFLVDYENPPVAAPETTNDTAQGGAAEEEAAVSAPPPAADEDDVHTETTRVLKLLVKCRGIWFKVMYILRSLVFVYPMLDVSKHWLLLHTDAFLAGDVELGSTTRICWGAACLLSLIFTYCLSQSNTHVQGPAYGVLYPTAFLYLLMKHADWRVYFFDEDEPFMDKPAYFSLVVMGCILLALIVAEASSSPKERKRSVVYYVRNGRATKPGLFYRSSTFTEWLSLLIKRLEGLPTFAALTFLLDEVIAPGLLHGRRRRFMLAVALNICLSVIHGSMLYWAEEDEKSAQATRAANRSGSSDDDEEDGTDDDEDFQDFQDFEDDEEEDDGDGSQFPLLQELDPVV